MATLVFDPGRAAQGATPAALPPPDPSAMDYATDIAKSGVHGVESGVAGLVGMPGDIMDISSRINRQLEQRAGPDAPTEPAGPSVAATDVGIPIMPGRRSAGEAQRVAPTSGEVKAAASKAGVPLMDYTPKTMPGEFARTIGEFAPNALMGGGGAIPRLVSVVAPAVASEAAGQVARQVAPDWENAARMGGGLAGGIAGGVGTALAQRPSAETVARVQAAAGEGVPLTLGQATGDVAQQAREQAMLNAAKGGPAQREMQAFEQQQLAARQEAMDRRTTGLGDNPANPTTPAAAGAEAQTGLQTQAQNYREGGQEAFQRMEAGGATVGTGAVVDLPRQVRQSLELEGINLHDPNLGGFTGTRQAVNVLDRLPPGVGERGVAGGTQATSVPLETINDARKRLNQISANPMDRTDARALGVVKQHFDNWMENAVEQRLFSGDPAALDELRNANDLWARYRAMTDPRGQAGRAPSDAQKLVQKIVNQERTPEEVGNWLMGTATVGGAGQASRAAAEIRSQLGPQSPAYEAIRRAYWQDITTPTRGSVTQGLEAGPRAVASKMRQALDPDGPRAALTRELFSPEEIRGMRRLQGVIESTQPLPRATNPSKSGYEFGRALKRMAGAAAGGLGLAAGGPTGAVIGYGLGAGGNALADLRSAAQARQATRGFVAPPTPWQAAGRGTAANALLGLQSAYGGQ
jgi:hypothetical protein